MPTTIDAAFKKLQSNLEITSLQASTVSTRQKNVREVVEAGMTVLDSFLAGSYQRNTLIAPLASADIDIFIVLDPKHFVQDGQVKLLDQLRKVLLVTYTKTPKISRNGQAVTITFTDFKVDVVPCFNRNGGGFLIPDSTLNRWIPTNPKVHVDTWSAENKTHGGDLVPLLKLLKGWNRQSDAMSSFHLETLAIAVLSGVTISNSWSGVRYVFDKGRERIPLKLADPAGYSDDVAAQVNTQEKIDAIVSALETARKRAVAAEAFAANGQVKAAFEKWQLIFGDYFPSYG